MHASNLSGVTTLILRRPESRWGHGARQTNQSL